MQLEIWVNLKEKCPKGIWKICWKNRKKCFAIIINKKHNGLRMLRKKPCEEDNYEDFFSRFDFENHPDGMGDFSDK